VRSLAAGDFRDRVTFIIGPGRASGKTALLNAGLALLRAAGVKPAFLGMGFDGELKGGHEEARPGRGARPSLPRIGVEPGELFVSAESWIATASIRPEIVALLPGSGALGRLVLARAGRRGEVLLVGPDSNESAREAVRLAREEGGASSVLVDGALDRVTQVASVPGAGFLATFRLDPIGLPALAAKMRLLSRLTGLETAGAGAVGNAEESVFSLEGPLTSSTLETLPETARTLVVEDFTKVFLDSGRLDKLERSRELRVRRRIDFGGFVVVLQGIKIEGLLAELGEGFPSELLIANPFEARASMAVA